MPSNVPPPPSRPVPYTSLKQRTSSVDCRKDYSQQTLFSLLRLLKLREYFVTVDHFKIWRRHLAWAKQNGSDLRNHLTQRFASNMVFMSLLLGAELNVLFNSSHITTKMRQDMSSQNIGSFEFWIGIVIIISAVLTLLTLITTFTAWGMVSSISDNNAHCVLRSSIGQYVVHLPSNLVVAAIYSFLLWVVLWLFVMLPGIWPYVLLLFLGALFFHIVIVFSAFGRLIMHSGAMGTERIFDEEFEQDLLPHGLHTSLLCEAMANLEKNKSITRQYRRGSKENSLNSSMEFDYSNRSLRSTGSDRQMPSWGNESFSKSPFSMNSGKKNPAGGNMIESESTTSLDGWLNKNIEVDKPKPFQKNKKENPIKETPLVTKNSSNQPPKEQKGDIVNIETPPLTKNARRTSSGTPLPRPSILNSANHSRKSMSRINVLAIMGEESPDPSQEEFTPDEVRRERKVSWDKVDKGRNTPDIPKKKTTPDDVKRRRQVSWDNVNMEKILNEAVGTSPSEQDTPVTSHKRPLPPNGLDVIREPADEGSRCNATDIELGERIGVSDNLTGEEILNAFSLKEEMEAEKRDYGSVLSDNGNDFNPANESQHLLSDREGTKQFNYSTQLESGQRYQRNQYSRNSLDRSEEDDALLFGA